MDPINWDVVSEADFNRRNPCCCPVPEAVPPEYQIEYRDLTLCKGGYGPFTKQNEPEDTGEEPYPDAFDIYPDSGNAGTKIPVYKHKQVRSEDSETAECRIHALEYDGAENVLDSYFFDAATDFDETVTQDAEYRKPLEDWPAGNYPYSACGPGKSIFPGEPPGERDYDVGIPYYIGDDYVVDITFSWEETRTPNGAGFWGTYEIMVDGEIGEVDGTEVVMTLLWSDYTCHEWRVRAKIPSVVGTTYGQWTNALEFGAHPPLACCHPGEMACDEESEGNLISSIDQDTRNKAGDTWSVTTGSDTDSGDYDSCDPPTIPNPTGFTLNFPRDFMSTFGEHDWTTRLPHKETRTRIWVVDHPDEYPDDPVGVTGWILINYSAEGSMTAEDADGETVEKVGRLRKDIVEFTEDQNGEEAGGDAIFEELKISQLDMLDETYGWGATLTGRPWRGHAASLYHWPVVGDPVSQLLRIDVRQARVRWQVPEDHPLESYGVYWSYARFSEQWLEWKAAYWEWALAKWAFVSKPAPGDPDYPVIGDFTDDPETEDDEAQEALDAAIAALDAITDPGEAPEEPEALRPVVISDPEVLSWEWTSEQGVQEPEEVGGCDPTYEERTLIEPVDPGEGATTEQIEAYEEALAEYEAAVAARDAASTRQSPWFILGPDRWARWITEPVPPGPLPPDPTSAQIAKRIRLMGAYETLTDQFQSARRESVWICNVRYSGIPNAPFGPVFAYDPRFLTTDLPPLHPTEADPAAWELWWT